MFPLFLDLTERLSVVIGGGSVGRRKASAVLASGGCLRLICLEPRPADATDPRIDWRTALYTADHLDGASLVFAAATPAVNERVIADAKARGIWVNAASAPRRGDFFLPATVRRGDFVLSISTAGAAPALTQVVRERLETEFDAAFGLWVSMLAELRPLVMERVVDAERRQSILTRLCQWDWLERLRREDMELVRSAMRAEIEEATQGNRVPEDDRGPISDGNALPG